MFAKAIVLAASMLLHQPILRHVNRDTISDFYISRRYRINIPIPYISTSSRTRATRIHFLASLGIFDKIRTIFDNISLIIVPV